MIQAYCNQVYNSGSKHIVFVQAFRFGFELFFLESHYRWIWIAGEHKWWYMRDLFLAAYPILTGKSFPLFLLRPVHQIKIKMLEHNDSLVWQISRKDKLSWVVSHVSSGSPHHHCLYIDLILSMYHSQFWQVSLIMHGVCKYAKY